MVEQLEEQQIDLRIVRWVAGEGEPAPEQRKWVDQLRRERGDGFYSDLIFALLGQRYSQSDAHALWQKIVSHRNTLTQALGRNPGVVVAALDLLSNLQGGKGLELSLIESSKLETMLERAVVDGLTGLYDHDTLLTLLEKEIEVGFGTSKSNSGIIHGGHHRQLKNVFQEASVPPWLRDSIPLLVLGGEPVAVGDWYLADSFAEQLSDVGARLRWLPENPLLKFLQSQQGRG